jgi:hypothetical protein
MTRDPGNSFKKAKLLPLSSQPFQLRDRLGGRDRSDVFSFRLSQRSTLNASLNNLKTKLKIKLFDSRKQAIAQSQKRSPTAQQLQIILEPGEYFIQLKSRKTSPYRLQVSAQPIPLPNTPPVLIANTGLKLSPGATLPLTPALLKTTDPDGNPLTYTLATVPKFGSLKLNAQTLSPGSTFTQADIDNGTLTYTHNSNIRQLTQDDRFTAGFDGSIDGQFAAWSASDGNDTEIYQFDGNIVTQITNNKNTDYTPKRSGKNIVWGSYDGNDDEIFFYNGSTIIQLTDNDRPDLDYHISGDYVLWQTDDGNDTEYWLYNGSTITQLTNNDNLNYNGKLSGRNIVWEELNKDRSEIYFYNGTNTTWLTQNLISGYNPVLSGQNVVWQASDGQDSELFFYNGSTTTQLTQNTIDDHSPVISGSNVAWLGNDGNDDEIFFYNGTTITQLTNNTVDERDLQISGDRLVWTSQDGADQDIFFYNGSIVQLTQDNQDDITPQLSDTFITWRKLNGSGYNIFFYNGTQTQPLTNTNQDQYALNLSGNYLIWAGLGGADGGADSEIFFANLAQPNVFGFQDGFEFTVSDGTGGSVTGTFSMAIAETLNVSANPPDTVIV